MEPRQRAVLPSLSHLSYHDEALLYIPAEDTYLLCDALLQEEETLTALNPQIVVEIGCGSGCVITYLCQQLAKCNIESFTAYATDINPIALERSQKTAERNNVTINFVKTNFLDAIEAEVCGRIDVLLFNPPYVPTPSEEIQGDGVEASWAGGVDGREVIDKFLPRLKDYLSSRGLCYLILVQENRPEDVSRVLASHGMASQVICQKRAVNEQLMVMKIWRSA
eukprot:gene27866-33651_t